MSITSIKRNMENISNKHNGHKLLSRIHKKTYEFFKKTTKEKSSNNINQLCSEDPTEKTFLPNW